MLVSLQLEAKYFSSVDRLMNGLSKNMRKKLRTKVEKADVLLLPISGLIGTNLKTRVEKSICSWWVGPCQFEALDAVEVPPRDPKGPFSMSVFRVGKTTRY
ncbi:hypothetical protein VNO77_33153 [Canavalia gladiata]|uniref:Uncharacterized protein n=1 Tax=Canavalia gladiata TaxID=3824 RepID=A0AAN9KD87_CANGL